MCIKWSIINFWLYSLLRNLQRCPDHENPVRVYSEVGYSKWLPSIWIFRFFKDLDIMFSVSEQSCQIFSILSFGPLPSHGCLPFSELHPPSSFNIGEHLFPFLSPLGDKSFNFFFFVGNCISLSDIFHSHVGPFGKHMRRVYWTIVLRKLRGRCGRHHDRESGRWHHDG